MCPTAIVAAAAAGLLALAGCGAAKALSPVASVQGRPISRASLAQWVRIENARLYGSSAPFLDPPRYDRCVAAANVLQARSKRPPLASRALRKRCVRVYAQLEDKALAFLITAKWIEGEAAAQGVHASPSEARATYERLLNGPAGSTFAANMRHAGMDRADELLQLRLERLAAGLRTKIAAGSGGVSAAQIAAYRQRWKRRTSCRAGYVIAECANGPPLPATQGG